MRLKLAFLYILFIISVMGMSSLKANEYNFNTTTTKSYTLQDGFKIHSVKKGQTVYSIAKSYDMSAEDIYKINSWARKGISTGDKLKIPNADKSNAQDIKDKGKTKQTQEISKPIAGYRDHIVETKQTLYSLGLIYNVSVEDILAANPGLDEKKFPVGKTIRIPIYKESLPDTPAQIAATPTPLVNEAKPVSQTKEHKVKKGETIFGISREHNITESELYKSNPSLNKGLKTDMVLIIPVVRHQQPGDTLILPNVVEPTPEMKKGEMMRIGIILPFAEKNGSVPQDKLVEYYNGFLLGVKELKNKGFNVEVYTLDTGPEKNTKKLKSLLETLEVKSLHLIIGGVSQEQIAVLSDFSLKTGIKYVVPFGSKKESVVANVFQITTSHSYLYPKSITAFKNKFKGYNIIFVSETGSDNNKLDFVRELKTELTGAGMHFNDIVPSEDILKDLKAVMDPSKKNLFIPTSSSEISIRKLLAIINMTPNANASFFGYPDWQTYFALHEQLHKYDSYIYSAFFLDEKQKKTQDITEEYKKWYNKPMAVSYPRFAFLGYDTAIYFMTALNTHGSHFEEHINSIKVPTLQSSIFFEPDIKDGGYINTGIYFVRFKLDMSIEKIEYTK